MCVWWGGEQSTFVIQPTAFKLVRGNKCTVKPNEDESIPQYEERMFYKHMYY
jgi:hypothetical protein